MPTPTICLMCCYWEAGLCDNEASPEYNTADVEAGFTCPYWESLEILKACSTCSYWAMYRRERVCNNPDVHEYGLLMKPSECCGDGWKEKTSLMSPIRRRPS